MSAPWAWNTSTLSWHIEKCAGCSIPLRLKCGAGIVTWRSSHYHLDCLLDVLCAASPPPVSEAYWYGVKAP